MLCSCYSRRFICLHEFQTGSSCFNIRHGDILLCCNAYTETIRMGTHRNMADSLEHAEK